MSVILVSEQKFQDIFEALRRRPKILLYFFYGFGGPDEIPDESKLALFVGQLHLGNVASYNERYGEEEQPRAFDFGPGGSAGRRWNDLELIKALKSMDYQNGEGETSPEHKKTGDRLRELIYSLMSSVINKMPGYDQAGTW